MAHRPLFMSCICFWWTLQWHLFLHKTSSIFTFFSFVVMNLFFIFFFFFFLFFITVAVRASIYNPREAEMKLQEYACVCHDSPQWWFFFFFVAYTVTLLLSFCSALLVCYMYVKKWLKNTYISLFQLWCWWVRVGKYAFRDGKCFTEVMTVWTYCVKEKYRW